MEHWECQVLMVCLVKRASKVISDPVACQDEEDLLEYSASKEISETKDCQVRTYKNFAISYFFFDFLQSKYQKCFLHELNYLA